MILPSSTRPLLHSMATLTTMYAAQSLSQITFRNIFSSGGLVAGYFTCNPGELACEKILMENVTLANTAGNVGCSFTNTFGNGADVIPKSCIPPTK